MRIFHEFWQSLAAEFPPLRWCYLKQLGSRGLLPASWFSSRHSSAESVVLAQCLNNCKDISWSVLTGSVLPFTGETPHPVALRYGVPEVLLVCFLAPDISLDDAHVASVLFCKSSLNI